MNWYECNVAQLDSRWAKISSSNCSSADCFKAGGIGGPSLREAMLSEDAANLMLLL